MSTDQTFSVDFFHHPSAHTIQGALETLRTLIPEAFPKSVLDVGCGTGTWLRASLECGASEVAGVDGIDLPDDRLVVPKEHVRRADLNRPLDLGRRFDLVLCLEIAEHLEPENAGTIVDTLTRHGDRILFSAAVPAQGGIHHVNCQWPGYWQRLFNERGYACDDSVRWSIWDNPNIETWYRQNLMLVVRDEDGAGQEPRIKSVIHPDLLPSHWSYLQENREVIEAGVLPWPWYLSTPLKAVAAKLRRRLTGK